MPLMAASSLDRIQQLRPHATAPRRSPWRWRHRRSATGSCSTSRYPYLRRSVTTACCRSVVCTACSVASWLVALALSCDCAATMVEASCPMWGRTRARSACQPGPGRRRWRVSGGLLPERVVQHGVDDARCSPASRRTGARRRHAPSRDRPGTAGFTCMVVERSRHSPSAPAAAWQPAHCRSDR